MKYAQPLLIAFALLLLAGCATAPRDPIALSEDYYANEEFTVGIYMRELPETKMYLPGADCLLCIAVVNAANKKISEHVETLPSDEVGLVRDIAERALAANSVKTLIIEDSIGFDELTKVTNSKRTNKLAKKDFRPLKESLGIDHLLILDIDKLGGERVYSGYIPTGSPTSFIQGEVYIVNLTTNEYELYEHVEIKSAIQGEWDEPPSFPGLTNAYYQSVEELKIRVGELF